jgi:membrane associated rhomboid family serine protease
MEQTCYRHPDRETGVSCSSCARPICTDCMIPTPVGMRCPECARQKTKVRTAASLGASSEPRATYVIIALNVAVFLAQTLTGGGGLAARSGDVYARGVLNGFDVNGGEWWRLLTSGFLHADPAHLLLNMVGLFFLGQMLEPALGTVRYVALYVGSLLAGSLGVLLWSPEANTVGASGAVFGLLGAAFLIMRQNGVDPMRSWIGPILILNLVLSFRPGISLGAHLGGLIGGLVCAAIIGAAERGSSRGRMLGIAGCVLVAVISVVAAIAASGTASLYDFGG